jgi:hypothetical protein
VKLSGEMPAMTSGEALIRYARSSHKESLLLNFSDYIKLSRVLHGPAMAILQTFGAHIFINLIHRSYFCAD